MVRPKTPSTTAAEIEIALKAAGDLGELKERIQAVAKLLNSCASIRVEAFAVGPPSTERGISELEPPADSEAYEGDLISFPEQLKETSRCFDGATLSWKASSSRHPTVAGAIHLSNLATQQEAKTGGIYESGLAWPVLLGAAHADIVSVDLDGLVLFGKFDGYCKADGLSLLEVVNTALDHLGIVGWELSLYMNGFDSDEDEDAYSRCRTTATAVWKTIAGRTPFK